MNTEASMTSPETLVGFRLSAPDLDPDSITALLGLTPDSVHRKGEHRRGDTKYAAYRTGTWVLQSALPRDQPLESHIEALLTILGPKISSIRHLEQDIEVDFYATIYDKNGFQLSPRVMHGIADLGAGLGVTIYPGKDT